MNMLTGLFMKAAKIAIPAMLIFGKDNVINFGKNVMANGFNPTFADATGIDMPVKEMLLGYSVLGMKGALAGLAFGLYKNGALDNLTTATSDVSLALSSPNGAEPTPAAF